MTTSNFYQFPIRLLNLQKSIEKVTPEEAFTRCQSIKRYCIWDIGTDLINGDEDDQQKFREMADRLYSRYIADDECVDAEWAEEVVWVGAEVLGCNPGSPRDPSPYQETFEHWNQFNYGRQQVRIRSDIIESTERGKMEWRQFAVLAAVYAAIGRDELACVTVKRLSALALGYNTPSEMGDSFEQSKLTDRQMRRTLDSLEARGWFARLSPNGRHMYYSNKLSEPELMEELVAREVKKARKEQAKKTEEIRRRVLQQLAAIEPPKPTEPPKRERLPRVPVPKEVER